VIAAGGIGSFGLYTAVEQIAESIIWSVLLFGLICVSQSDNGSVLPNLGIGIYTPYPSLAEIVWSLRVAVASYCSPEL
jgi:hypothetical protein